MDEETGDYPPSVSRNRELKWHPGVTFSEERQDYVSIRFRDKVKKD